MDKRTRFWVVLVALAGSVGLLFSTDAWARFQTHSNRTGIILFGLWMVGPPLWFLADWAYFKPDGKSFDEFKYSQELARNLWVAVSVLLGLMFGIKA